MAIILPQHRIIKINCRPPGRVRRRVDSRRSIGSGNKRPNSISPVSRRVGARALQTSSGPQSSQRCEAVPATGQWLSDNEGIGMVSHLDQHPWTHEGPPILPALKPVQPARSEVSPASMAAPVPTQGDGCYIHHEKPVEKSRTVANQCKLQI